MWWNVKHHSNCIIGAFDNVFKCVDDYLKRIQVNIAKEIVQKDLFLGLKLYNTATELSMELKRRYTQMLS